MVIQWIYTFNYICMTVLEYDGLLLSSPAETKYTHDYYGVCKPSKEFGMCLGCTSIHTVGSELPAALCESSLRRGAVPCSQSNP